MRRRALEHGVGVRTGSAAGEHLRGRRSQPLGQCVLGCGCPLTRTDDRGGAAHPREGAQRGLRDDRLDRVGGGELDQVESLGVAVVGEVAQCGDAGGLVRTAGRGEQFGAVFGTGDGGQAAGGGGFAGDAGMLVVAVLCPGEHFADAPAGPWALCVQLPLPAVEAARLLYTQQPSGLLGVVRVLGPQPPGPGLEGVAGGGRELRVALGGLREAGEDGRTEGTQARVVVADGQLVQRPLPVGPRRGVPAQQFQRRERPGTRRGGPVRTGPARCALRTPRR